jgi:hypothetical protein
MTGGAGMARGVQGGADIAEAFPGGRATSSVQHRGLAGDGRISGEHGNRVLACIGSRRAATAQNGQVVG